MYYGQNSNLNKIVLNVKLIWRESVLKEHNIALFIFIKAHCLKIAYSTNLCGDTMFDITWNSL